MESLNTNVNVNGKVLHVQTEFYEASGKITTMVFDGGKSILRIETNPNEDEDINEQIKKQHEETLKKLSCMKGDSSCLKKVFERTGLENVKYPQEVAFDASLPEEIRNFGQLVVAGAPIPPSLVILEGVDSNQINWAFKNLSRDSGTIIIRSSSRKRRVVYFNASTESDFENAIVECLKSEKTCLAMSLPEIKSSGFLFTSNPLTGENTVIIEAGWGICGFMESLRTNLDRFKVDKEAMEFWRIEKEIVRKTTGIFLDSHSGRISEKFIADEEAVSPSLTDNEILSLAKFALSVEKHFGKVMKLNFVASSEGEVLFTDISPVSVQERKELLRKLAYPEEIPFHPTGLKVFAYTDNYEAVKSISFLPIDGVFLDPKGVPESLLETAILMSAEAVYPRPLVVFNKKGVVSAVRDGREKGLVNLQVAFEKGSEAPPDIPSFKERETPFISGRVFEGIGGKLFLNAESLLSPNISLLREIITSGFDYLCVHPDEASYVKKLVASEERKLLVKMAIKFLGYKERL